MKEIGIVLTLDTEGPSAGKDTLASTWEEVQQNVTLLDEVTREKLTDSFGNAGIYSWFLLDWVGLVPNDSEAVRRNIALGHHAVFDWFRNKLLSDAHLGKTKDGYYWHYHHPHNDGSWGWNTQWEDNKMYEEILNHKVFERNYFPSVYAAGGYVQTNESSSWLEKWIPFDYSNNAPVKTETYDWSQSLRSWLPYHPAIDNYQVAGTMKRWVARRKPTTGFHSRLSMEDIEQAFIEAQEGGRPILSIITHDYTLQNSEDFVNLYTQIQTISKKYPDIVWRNRTALDAFLWSLSLTDVLPLTAIVTKSDTDFLVEFSHDIFCEQPWVVVKKALGSLLRVDAIVVEKGRIYQLPKETVAFAANDTYGNTFVMKL